MTQDPTNLYPLKAEHLRSYLTGLQALRSEQDQFDLLLRNAAPAQAEKLGNMPQAWGHLYELPLWALLFRIKESAGMAQSVRNSLASTTPVDSMIKIGETLSATPVESPPADRFAEILGLSYVARKNIHCILIYGQSLHCLILAATKGDNDALLKALRIDPSVVSAPTVAERLDEARQFREQGFLEEIQKALNGPSQKIKPEHDELRLVLALLR